MNTPTIGVIGCGVISARYLQNLTGRFDSLVHVAAVADVIPERAKARAEEFDIPKAYSNEELLADDEIQFVLNLTNPQFHGPLNMAALEAGKHAYVEKPFAVTRNEGLEVTKVAAERGLRLGCAPDTFLGAGIQTSRKLIDDGWVGKPIAARGMIGMPGPFRGKHPSGDVFYRAGAGPLFDMAPYYLTALVTLFGPIRRASGSAIAPFEVRRFQHPDSPLFGKAVPVEVPTSVSAVLEFENNVHATLTAVYDSPEYTPELVVYGTDAVLTVNDPNTFGGPVLLKQAGQEPRSIPLTHALSENSRGIGIVDMCLAQEENRSHRADGSMAVHVLDVMEGIVQASVEGSYYAPATTCRRPAPLATGPTLGSLDHFGC